MVRALRDLLAAGILTVRQRLPVAVEGEATRPDRGDFILLVVRAVDGPAAVARRAADVTDRVERPGDGARRADEMTLRRK